ncbi:PTS system IIA component, Gat family [Actinomyces ruminicola]|uniref:PTS system IIA component, Gat family n=1 Tax=Actinomyces ruminicola TaxID=332524 RepID=A0A1H0BHM6_9ACTO|nr:PTS sugar transporter subunit IIA [Actinomyces ruminicola]SDN45141.1 PTS system IIA component, Gat family [Actinomyces ruminicola]
MQLDLLKRDLVRLDWEVRDRDDFFDRISAELLHDGYIRESFRDALAARERKYPTALPTAPEAVAIPHSDAEHIVEPFIAPVRLATPIDWHEMGNDDVVHPVRFIFVLGFVQEDGHVEVLQVLLQDLQDPAFMEQLDRARTPDEYYRVLSGMADIQAP